jgi:hypothetical protein
VLKVVVFLEFTGGPIMWEIQLIAPKWEAAESRHHSSTES